MLLCPHGVVQRDVPYEGPLKAKNGFKVFDADMHIVEPVRALPGPDGSLLGRQLSLGPLAAVALGRALGTGWQGRARHQV